MLTQAELKAALHYEPATGTFWWRYAKSARVQAGQSAGSETQGYINIQVDGALYRAHRLAWLYVYGEWPSTGIDHINGNSLDNRLANLRLANQSQNTANGKLRSDCASGFKGVTKYRSRWVATIRVSGKKLHLGVFDTPEIAHEAYIVAAKKFHGQFARAA